MNCSRTLAAACCCLAACFATGCQDARSSDSADGSVTRSPQKKADPFKGETLSLGGGIKLQLIRIEAGEYAMGTDSDSRLFEDDERPSHLIQISRPFLMGRTEVTQAQWEAVMGDNPARFSNDFKPVHNVSWNDTQAFCEKLSESTGRTVRLPTEAEWEYACRAGSSTIFEFGDEPSDLLHYGWHEENTEDGPMIVATQQPNAWGLHDMHGNVFEWCSDWYDESYYGWSTNTDPAGPQVGEKRVLRGGSWYTPAWSARSAYRTRSAPDGNNEIVGLRVVVELDE